VENGLNTVPLVKSRYLVTHEKGDSILVYHSLFGNLKKWFFSRLVVGKSLYDLQ